MCSSIWHRSLGNKRGVDSARGRLLRWTLSLKWNKDVIISSAGLNQKPFEMWYKASKMDPLLWTMCWRGKRLDRSMWSIMSIHGGRCLLNKMVPTVMSRDSIRTISLGEGWGHCLYSTYLARTTGRLKVAAMSEAISIPGRPSMEK